ncbi:MAG: methylenetetrahydrofolate reductase [Pseudomonadota bacterium]
MNHPELSVELFPPKASANRFWRCVGQLEALNPEFVSITCGALASAHEPAFDTAVSVNANTRLRVCTHVTLSAFPKGRAVEAIDALYGAGIRRVMVLRGDGEHAGDSVSVADVVDQVQRAHPLDIAVACYPETHPMAASAAADLDCLKQKCDAGAARAVAQMVFSADAFLRFRDRAQAHGIDVPLHAGILPVVDFAKAKRLAAQCGAELPRAYEQAYEGTEGNGPVQRELGIAFATELSATLAAEGVDGLHLYAMNSPGLATELVESLAIAPNPQPVSQPAINGNSRSAQVVHASQLARARFGLRSVVAAV